MQTYRHDLWNFDEKKWLDENTEAFKDYYLNKTGINLDKQKARELLYTSAKYSIDAVDNGIQNIKAWFGLAKFSKDDIKNTINFIYEKSARLQFENYNDIDELPHLQDYFTTNDKQFNYGGDFNQEPQGALVDVSGMFLPIIGGVVANTATKGLSNLILNQTAKTSVKAGLIGAGIDTGMQVGTQIYDQAINNNGYVDLRDIDLNYDSILFSGVAGAVTIPTVRDSYRAIKDSIAARQTIKQQMKNTQTVNKLNKLQGRYDKHKDIIYNNIKFQGANISSRYFIKDNILEETNE